MTQPNDSVTKPELRLVEQSIEREREERRHELRRRDDRIAAIEVTQVRHGRILLGEQGTNGLAADVRSLKMADRKWERIGWILVTAVVSTIAGLAGWYLRA